MDIIFVEPEETDQTVQMRRLRLNGYPHRLCRWPERLPGRYQCGISSDVSCIWTQQPAVRIVEAISQAHGRIRSVSEVSPQYNKGAISPFSVMNYQKE